MKSLLLAMSAVLALAGSVLSFYFLGVYRHWFSGHQRWVPRLCRMESGQCTRVIDTPYGRLLGSIPNVVWGTVGELGFAVLLLLTLLRGWTLWLPLVVSGGTLLLGIYLIYGLIRLRTACPVCLTVHSLNLLIFLFLILALP